MIIVVGAAEFSLRAYHSVRWNTPFWTSFGGLYQTDKHLGWTPKAFYSYHLQTSDNAGAPYHIQYKTVQYGFREWSNSDRLNRRVLFVGDSYTQAKDVSNDKTYYNVAKRHFPMEVFAFGAGGYGTLQEYLVLDEHLDEIKPDVIVWQFTPNDFIDNDPVLDSRGGGVKMGTRPYLVDGSVKYVQSDPAINRILYNAAEITSSRLLRILHNRVFLLTRARGALYDEMEEIGRDHSGFARSYSTTQNIMQMVLERADGAEVVAFSVRDQAPFYQAFRNMMKGLGIGVIEEVPEALNAAENSGVEIRALDGGHWNEKGHEIVGTAIARRLERLLGQQQIGSEGAERGSGG